MSFLPGFDRPQGQGAYGQPLRPVARPPASNATTSAAAADAIEPHVNRLEGVVLHWLSVHGPATDEEGIAGTGLSASTYRPRRVALVERGLVEDAGLSKRAASGRMAIAWKVTRKGEMV